MSEPFHPEVAILNAALELPADQRIAYLDQACASDAALRRKVEALLLAHEQAEDFLDAPPAGFDFTRTRQTSIPFGEKPGDKVGRYKLLEQIGEGGCGVVFMAGQEEPMRRRVALKVIKLGMDTKQVIARFEAERQALALMDHPNIARVLDAGATETGRPYFVMELVRGIKITEFCDENNVSTQERLKLFIQVCQAIQHAHQKGVIHRDIKPSNILVTVNDGVPVPKVIDFGIAKATQGRLTDQTLFTAFEQFIGTPAYMSPEQAVMTSLDIDTRSDIYSLGVLLYELLTGRTPFDQKELLAAGLDEMRRTIREKEPLKPSTRLTQELSGFAPERRDVRKWESEKVGDTTALLAESHLPTFPPAHLQASLCRSPHELQTLIHVLRGDLDWIVMKCLEKDRARRYETANGLARDIERHLNNEPIAARAPTRLYRFRKLVQRNKLTFAAVAVLAIALVMVAVGSTVAAWRVAGARRAEQSEREKAETANRQLRQTVNLLELERAEDFFTAHDAASGVAHLSAMLRRDPSNQLAANRLVSALLHRNWALPLAGARRHLGPVTMVSFSRDGRLVLSASRDNTASVWDAVTGARLATVRHGDRIHRASFSPDGSRFVTASADGTARVWDATNGSSLTPPLAHTNTVYWAEFSADGGRVVTASADRTARIWDAASGELKRVLRGHGSHVILARFNPDGHRVATGGSHGSIRLWNVDTGETLSRVEDRRTNLTALTFSPDGRWLLTACADGIARLWDAGNGHPVARPLEHRKPIDHAVFSPDSRLVLTCSQDNMARLWDAATGAPISQPLVHEGGVLFGAFSPDGQAVATASMDNSARLWDVRTGTPLCQPLRQYEGIFCVDFSPDGQRLVTGSYDWFVQVWDVRPRRAVETELQRGRGATSVSFSPDGEIVLTSSRDTTARLLNARTGQLIGEPIRHSGRVHMGAFSRDGRQFVTASISRSAYVRDTATGATNAEPFQHAKGIWFAQFSPDGDRLVTASADGTARVWHLHTGQAITPPLAHGGEVRMAQFSPDGRHVVTASDDYTARVWDAQTGQPVTELLAHLDQVKWAEFSPDGEQVVTASADNTACIWDARTGKRAAPPLQHARLVHKAVFNPDGRRVATISLDRTARIWDAATGQAVTPPLPHGSPLTELRYSPDGRRVLTGCGEGRLRVWDAETGRPLTEWLDGGSYVSSACFDPTGRRVAGAAKGVRVWELPSAPTPLPEWFPAFAEAVAGIRLDARGNVGLVSRTELDQMTQRLPSDGSGDFYERLARWFLSDPISRAGLPF